MWKYLLAAFIILAIGHHADYLLQAYQWGWWTWWELDPSGAKFGPVTFDSWHLAQMVRNLGWGVGLVGGYAVFDRALRARILGTWRNASAFGLAWALGLAARFIGFSIFHL